MPAAAAKRLFGGVRSVHWLANASLVVVAFLVVVGALIVFSSGAVHHPASTHESTASAAADAQRARTTQLLRHALEAQALRRVNEGADAWRYHPPTRQQQQQQQQQEHSARPIARGADQQRLRHRARPFFVVVAPESSGNRYVTSLLLAAGCAGSDTYEQPFDDRDDPQWVHAVHYADDAALRFRDVPCLVVFRSVPHAGELVHLARLVAHVERLDFEPRVLIVLRAEPTTAQSQYIAQHAESIQAALQSIVRAQHHIVEHVSSVPGLWYRFVHYSELRRDDYVHWLLTECGVTPPLEWPAFDSSRDEQRWREFMGIVKA